MEPLHAPKTLAGQLTALRAHPRVTSLLTGRLATSAASDIDIEVIEPHQLTLNSPPAASAGNELARFGHLLVVLGPSHRRLMSSSGRSKRGWSTRR